MFFNAGSITVLLVLLLTGCVSTQYTLEPPVSTNGDTRSKIVNRPKDEVWDEAVARVGQRFFVINNLERSSGLINISYSGDPESYVDCGKITVETKAVGGKTMSFNGSAMDVTHEMTYPIPPYYVPTVLKVRRSMKLDGRINLIFEALNEKQTKVTAATRYVLTRTIVPQTSAMLASQSDTASFNANETGSFPSSPDGRTLRCVSNGVLESSILDLLN